MHPDCFRDRPEIHRPQVTGSVVEKCALLPHDLAPDLEDRRGALIETARKPAGTSGAFDDEFPVPFAARRTGNVGLIGAIEDEARHRQSVEFDVELPVRPHAHVKVGRQAGDGRLPECKPRLGIETAKLGQHEVQRFLVDAAEATKAGFIPPGHQVEASQKGFHRMIEPPAFAELDAEALGKIRAAIPGGSRPWTRRSAVSTIPTSQPSASAISRVSSTRYPASLRLRMMYRPASRNARSAVARSSWVSR